MLERQSAPGTPPVCGTLGRILKGVTPRNFDKSST